jgi:hypothetical protein
LTRASAAIAAALLSASLLGGEQNTEDCAPAKIDGNEVTIRATSYDAIPLGLLVQREQGAVEACNAMEFLMRATVG